MQQVPYQTQGCSNSQTHKWCLSTWSLCSTLAYRILNSALIHPSCVALSKLCPFIWIANMSWGCWWQTFSSLKGAKRERGYRTRQQVRLRVCRHFLDPWGGFREGFREAWRKRLGNRLTGPGTAGEKTGMCDCEEHRKQMNDFSGLWLKLSL
jgi:hypothetical protein